MIIDIENKRIEFILDGEWIKIDNFDKIAQQVNEQIQDWAFKLAMRYWMVYSKDNYLPNITPYKFLFDDEVITINMNALLHGRCAGLNLQMFLNAIFDSITDTKTKVLEKIGKHLVINKGCVHDYNKNYRFQYRNDVRRKRINDALYNQNPDILNWALEIDFDDNRDAKLEFENKPQFNSMADIWNSI